MAIKADRLKDAGAGLDKFFTSGGTAPEETTTTTKPQPKKKDSQLPKKVFSFRTDADSADTWRLWASAKGLKVDDLGTLAITEYIKRHPLTETEKQIYDLRIAQKENMNS